MKMIKPINVLIVLLIAIIVIMSSSGSRVSCGGEETGIVSLQVANSYPKAIAIKQEWQKKCPSTECMDCEHSRMHYAIINIWLDYIFIILYTLFLLALNRKYNYKNPARPKRYEIVRWIIVAVFCLDVLENVGMMGFLTTNRNWYPVFIFWIPAYLKWIGIAIIFIWGLPNILETITGILKDIFRIFLILPLAIISLLVLFFVIWQSDQGQDLLLTINDYPVGPLCLYGVLIFLAFMNWHFPKFFLNADFKTIKFRTFFREDFTYLNQGEQNIIAIPRLFGILTLLIPAFGILQLFKVFRLPFMFSCTSPFILLVITTLFFHLCYRHMIFQKFQKKYPNLFLAVCAILFLVPFTFGIFNNREAKDLQWIFYGLLSYAFLFSMIAANRTEVNKYLIFKFLSNRNITPVIWCMAAIPSLLFLFFAIQNIFCVSFNDVRFLSLTIVISGIVFYYVIFTLLNILGREYKIGYSLMLLVVMLLVSVNIKNDYHYVSQIKPKSNTVAPTLRQYATGWLRNRAASQPNDSVYKIYLVNTYGGGIRASAWTCMAINRLDSLQKLYKGDLFQDHVFCYSGASGGTVGASILCANRYHSLNNVKTNDYVSLYSNDFLTQVLVGALGNDVWYGGFGINASDRSVVQDRLWAKHYKRVFRADYDLAFDDIWRNVTDYRVPLLFSNTTDFKEGRKGIYAPLKLDSLDFPGATLVHELMHDTASLKLGTGAFLSARFPYISPAAGIRQYGNGNKSYHFLDGGMVENSGAETLLQVYNVLRRVIDDSMKNSGKRYEIYVISLKNTFTKDDTVLKEKNKNVSQITAPIAGAVSIGLVGNTKKAEQINRRYFASRYFRVEPVSNEIKLDGEPTQVPLPLGWSISEKALSCMNFSLIRSSTKDSILFKIVTGN